MIFNSREFLIFFPIVSGVYFVLPKRVRQYWLLVASYYFYMCWNPTYILLILASTVITFVSGLLLERVKQKGYDEKKEKSRKNMITAVSFVLSLSILFYYKYINFVLGIVQAFFMKMHIALQVPQFDIMLPVGISFFTFQALSYTMDVYRNEIYAEKNFFRYALFVSFFPQLVAGPIERSKNLLSQLAKPQKFSFERAKEGLLLMLWGLFLKIVLADRIAIFVDTVYNDPVQFKGYYLIVATILFAIQIYCDFAGYSVIAMGAAKILGIQLMQNFNAPYLSTSVAEFWRNWHISLTSWFKDYLYIPLGGSRKGKLRKYSNKLIVFLVSGLWHGASFAYVIWGGLNGIYQIIGEVTLPARKKVQQLFHLQTDSLGHKMVHVLITFVLVDFSWIFFRAGNISDAIKIFQSMFPLSNPEILFTDALYNCGLETKNFHLMMYGIVMLFIADFFKKKGIKIREVILKQDVWFRWLVIDVAVVGLLVFGVWGSTYDAANFIYFQF